MRAKIMQSALFIVITMTYLCWSAQVSSLYSDHRALRADDILTVLIVESAKAGSESGTQTGKKHDVSAGANGGTGLLGFLPSFGASGGSNVNYNGKGSTTREGSLVAKVSARVVKVLDNGNLVIEGSKEVEINNEKELIKVSGTVRPQDIGAENFIYSYNICDAKITYSGRGDANTGQRPGLFARFFNWIF